MSSYFLLSLPHNGFRFGARRNNVGRADGNLCYFGNHKKLYPQRAVAEHVFLPRQGRKGNRSYLGGEYDALPD